MENLHPDNYYWGHNHGIYQDGHYYKALFKDSQKWTNIANDSNILTKESPNEDKEHSPAYHYLVMKLFIDVNLFNQHYGIENQAAT